MRIHHLPILATCLVTGISLAQADDGTPSDDSSWLSMVSATQEEQPHWMTPLVTVTPRLEQEFRYDQYWQAGQNGVSSISQGGGKGLEIIPSASSEVIVGIPNDLTKNTGEGSTSGWQDENLLYKYRIAAANEEHGNYIVTAFLGASLPTGQTGFTTKETLVTPTLALGKGWGSREQGVNIQSTFSYSIPSGSYSPLPVAGMTWNTSLQAHVFEYLWPEVEASYVTYQQGAASVKGADSLIMTYGVIVGRIPVSGRTKLILGFGYQRPSQTRSFAFVPYNHGWDMTARLTF